MPKTEVPLVAAGEFAGEFGQWKVANTAAGLAVVAVPVAVVELSEFAAIAAVPVVVKVDEQAELVEHETVLVSPGQEQRQQRLAADTVATAGD